jgi:hypothetical protein
MIHPAHSHPSKEVPWAFPGFTPAAIRAGDYFFSAAKLSSPRHGLQDRKLSVLSPEALKMAAVLVGQFHARDAEGRVYSVHEFQESTPSPEGIAGSEPVTTYRLAIGDRVNKMDDNQFLLVQSGITLIREPETTLPS